MFFRLLRSQMLYVKPTLQACKAISITVIMLIIFLFTSEAQAEDTISLKRNVIHNIAFEVRPGVVLPTNSFVSGENERLKPIKNSFSSHIKYSFREEPHSYIDRIFGGVYQGVGLAYHTFDEKKYLGSPIMAYLYQGARISQINTLLSLNYEWNFGLSSNWRPYDYDDNYYNKAIGSKVNAYMNANIYFSHTVSRTLDFIAGINFTHYSNGNTQFPNAGINTADVKLGVVYNINRPVKVYPKPSFMHPIPLFSKHISYDVTFFSSWRRKGVYIGEHQMASPYTYPVFGFNFAPMYNIGYKFRVGVSLDGFYDGSANVYVSEGYYGDDIEFIQPSFSDQVALGFSARAEYVMPYFSINFGLGANVLHGKGDLSAFYQLLALKVDITRNAFLHIGYSLQNFETPNFLMLGFGFRLNNKYPLLLR